MTDNDLETMYKVNVGESHYAGLRGVFDAGYALGAGSTVATAQNSDPSTSAFIAQALPDDPANITTA